jgi:hypothetical protein
MAKEKTTPAEEATKLNDAQAREQRHYFPEHNITITAETREEAEAELAEIIKQEKEDN